MQAHYPLCMMCIEKVKFIEGVRCKKCSMLLISENEICTRCREIDYHFLSNYSLFEYRGLVKELIYQYKFKAKKRLAYLFSEYLSVIINKWFNNMIVIPVPAQRKSIIKRGWDHVAVIAEILGKKYGIKVINCLKKKRVIPQKELGELERFKNIKGKIILKTRCLPWIFKEIVLLDDIFTTGATLNECSHVLKEYGVKKIYCITIAID